MNLSSKEFLSWGLRWILGIFILWLIAYQGFLPLDKLSGISFQTILTVIIVSLVMVLLIAVRLSLLFSVHSIQLPVKRSYDYCCLGLLTVLFVPSTISADVSKFILLARENNEHRTTTLITVLFDRLIGAFALALTATTLISGFLLQGNLEPGEDFYDKSIKLLFVSLGITGFCMLLLALAFSRKFFESKLLSSLFSKFEGFFHTEHIIPIITRFSNSFKILSMALGLSVLNHLFRVIVFKLISDDVGVKIDFIQLGFIISLASFVNIIPITPGNFGTGDAAFGFLFSYLGYSSGTLISVLARIVFFVPALYGAVVILYSKLGSGSGQKPDGTTPRSS